MNGTVGALKILIEADASGLTSQLKKAGSNITSFVGQMNKQEVNWTQILSRTISPAIISGIAATFALALTQAMSFTNQLTQSANTSTVAFGENSTAATEAALAIQSTTGQSANSVVEAMGYATRALGSYAAGEALVAEASKFALATGIPLLDLVKLLTPAMEAWGITDAAEITTTIEQLFGVAEQGKVSIGELLQTMANTGPMLRATTNILDASSALEAFSNQAGNTAVSAIAVFEKVAVAAFGDIKTQADFSALGVGNIKKAVEDGGMAKALTNLEIAFDKLGTTSQILLGNRAGFDSVTVSNLAEAAKSYKTMADDAKIISENAQSLGKKIETNLSPTNQLQIAWGKLKSELTDIALTLAPVLIGAIQGINSAIEGFKGSGKFKFTDFLGEFGKNLYNVLSLGTAEQMNSFGLYKDDKKSGNTSNSNQVNNYNNITNISSSTMGGLVGASSPNSEYLKTQGY